MPGGTYTVELGASSADIRLCGELSVQGEEISVPAWQKGSWYETPYGLPTDEDFEALFNGSIQPEPVIKRGSFTMEMSCMEMKDVSPIMNSMFKSTEKTIAQGFGGKVDYSDVAEGMVALANGHPIAGLQNLGGKPRKEADTDADTEKKGGKLPDLKSVKLPDPKSIKLPKRKRRSKI